MIWEFRQVLENVKKKLKQHDALPDSDGEIDFFFLSSLESVEAGKLSVLIQKLMAVFAQDPVSGDPAAALEDLAAMSLLWSANIRAQRQKIHQRQNIALTIGTKHQVRLPDYFPLFIGEIIKEGTIYIPALQQEYSIDVVTIIPEKSSVVKDTSKPVILQEELQKNLSDIQRNAQLRLLAIQGRK